MRDNLSTVIINEQLIFFIKNSHILAISIQARMLLVLISIFA